MSRWTAVWRGAKPRLCARGGAGLGCRQALLAALVVLCVTGAASAQDEQPSGGDGRRTVASLPVNLVRATFGVFNTDNLKPLLVGGAATGVGAIFDDDIAEWLADPAHGFGQSLEASGEPRWSGIAVGALFVTGRFVRQTRFRSVTYDWLDAFLVTAGYTTLLKEVVGRERPNGEDDKSFPSGHASNAFTLAAVAERHYGWKVGLPAYSVATAVALSRLQRDKHYLSDVMAGATIGYIVGRTVVRVNGQRPARAGSAQISLTPVIGPRVRALALYIAY